MGINALQAITTGTGNVAVGGFANTTLTTANNTIAIGTSSVATATDSIAFGNGSNTASSRAIVIGSRDSTNGVGAAPTAGAVDAIAIGSASGTHAGASAAGTSSIAIGASDGTSAGASAATANSIAVGVNATTSTNANGIAIGSSNGASAGASATGLASVALGGSDGTSAGASVTTLDGIAIGAGTSVTGANSVALGANTTVAQSNAIILGNIGLNTLSVGIGTNQPTAKLTVVGTGAGGVTPLRLVTPPLSTPTDFLLTIDASGNVRQTSSTAVFSSLSFSVCDLIVPAATPGTTITNTTCGFIELGGASPSTSNVDIYEVTGSGSGRKLFAGNYTTVPAITTASDNIAMGINALQAITTGTGNVAVGGFANTTLTTANNTIAIGTSSVATATDSIAFGNGSNTASSRAIVIGSRDSINGVGAAPTAGAVDAIAIGSASGALAGSSATGVGSIALGGSDGTSAGASATTLDGIAIGAGTNVTGANSVALGANTTVAQSNAIILGNIGLNALSVGIGTNQPTAKLTVVGTGAGGVTPLRLVTPPLQTPTDFLLTIDASGNVRQTSSTTAFSSLSFAPCNVILPAATAGTTITNTTCGFIELGGASPSTSNVDIYEVTGTGAGRNLFAGNYTTVPAITTASDNIAMGINALQAITTGTGNVAVGGFANTTLTTANNTIAIGTSSVATATDSIAFGNGSNTASSRAIVIGSRDSTNGVGAAPTAGAVDAIAIGSASGALAGSSATGVGSIALGGSDGTSAGASVTTLDGIAIGAGTSVTGANSVALGANTTVAQSNAIILGNIGLNTLSVGIGTNQPTAKLTVVGTGSGGVTPLRLVTPPLQTSTDFLLTIDASGNVRQTSSTTAFSSLSFAPCNVILPAATAGTTITNTTCGFIELGGASPSTLNVDIYEVGTRNLFAGNYTTVPAITTAADNNAKGTNALSAITSGTGNIAIGGFANTTLTTANNTIAIGTSSVATATDSIVFGNGSNTASSRAIVIGSRDSTNGVGAAPTAGAVDAIAIGSASGALAGASATGVGSIALGGSDGTSAGASSSGLRSVALGTGSIATLADTIVLGNPTSPAIGVTIGTNIPSTTFTTTARLTIVTSGNQNAIATSNGTLSAPAYSFIGTNTSVGMYSPGQNELDLVTSNTARLIIDATGSVTYFSKYRAHAYRNATQTVTNTTATIVFNSVASPGFDSNGNFSTGTGLYTAPVSGYYMVMVNVSFTSGTSNSTRTLDLIQNGAVITSYSAGGSSFNPAADGLITTHGIVQLNQNDTLGAQWTTAAGGGGDSLLANRTHISIHFFSTV